MIKKILSTIIVITFFNLFAISAKAFTYSVNDEKSGSFTLQLHAYPQSTSSSFSWRIELGEGLKIKSFTLAQDKFLVIPLCDNGREFEDSKICIDVAVKGGSEIKKGETIATVEILGDKKTLAVNGLNGNGYLNKVSGSFEPQLGSINDLANINNIPEPIVTNDDKGLNNGMNIFTIAGVFCLIIALGLGSYYAFKVYKENV